MKLNYLIDNLLSPEIQALSFIDKYAGVVRTVNMSIDGVDKKFPIACNVTPVDCNNISNFQDLVPDDSKKSVVYWEEVSPMQVVGFTPTNNYYNRKMQGTARLVVWLNLDKLGIEDCTAPIEILLELERILTKKTKINGGVFDDNLFWTLPAKAVQSDINTVFGKYTYPKKLNYYLHPFDFFAIDVTFTMYQCLSKVVAFPILPPVDCANTAATACEQILAMLTDTLKYECVLPTYDFSSVVTQTALSAQQITDIQNVFCTPIPSTCQEKLDFVASVWLTCIIPAVDFTNVPTQNAFSVQQILDLKTWLLPQYDFSDVMWQNLLAAQQKIDLTNYLLPLVDFTDIAIQSIVTTQQKADILAWLFPLLDFTDPATQALITAQQQTDLEDWLCTPVVPIVPASVIFDGVNETVSAPNNAVYDFSNSSPFTVSIWFKTSDVSVLRPIFSKRVNINKGYVMSVGGGKANIVLYGSNTLLFWVEANVTLSNNTWYQLTFSHDGTMTLAGIKIYLNAVSQSTTLIQNNIGVTTMQSGAAIAIARNSQTGTAYFLGNIWLTRIWNIALPQLSVTADYNAKSTPTAPATNLANLVFGWRGGENARWATVAIPVFVEETGLIVYPAIAGANLELADLTTNIPV